MSSAVALPADLESASIEEVKKTFQHMSAHAAVNLLHEYLELASLSDDPEVKRKCLVFLRENANLEAPKPKEEKQDYPVFNFVFKGATSSEPITVVAETPKGTQTLEFSPSVVMAANRHVNADVDFDD